MMKFLVLVFLFAAVWAQNSAPRCDTLPTQTLDASALVTQSPLRVVYANDPDYQCSTVFYTNPKDSTHTIASTYNKGSSVLANSELKFGSNKTFDYDFNCDGWGGTYERFLNMSVTQDKGFCIFTCTYDGDKFFTLRCMDGGGLTSDVFANVLTTVQGVPGGPTSGTTLVDCADPDAYCTYFNN